MKRRPPRPPQLSAGKELHVVKVMQHMLLDVPCSSAEWTGPVVRVDSHHAVRTAAQPHALDKYGTVDRR